jgi:hypothetical protein
MAVLNRDEFMNRVLGFVGDKTDDDSLSFIDDMADTFNSITAELDSGEAMEWKRKFEENDKAWRAKYKRRFSQGPGATVIELTEEEEEKQVTPETTTTEDLFKEEE